MTLPYGLMSSRPQPRRLLEPPDIEQYMPQEPEPQGFGDRLLRGLFPAPSSMRELVAPEDVEAARRQGMMSLGAAMMEGGGPQQGGSNFAQNLGRGISAGTNAFTSALQNAAQLAGYTEKLQGEREEKVRQKQVLQKRAGIIAKYAPQPNETVQQTAMRLQKMLPEFIAANDTEMVGKIVELLKSQGDLLGTKPQNIQSFDEGDKIRYRDPATGREWTQPKGMTPKDPNAQAGLQAQRNFQREQTLVAGFQKQIQTRLDAADFVNQTLAGVPAARAGDGAAQVELLYAFVKALDPASVVREGEVALAREATPLVEWAKANVDKVRNKAVVVPPAMVDRFAALLTRRLGGYEKYINRQRDYYINRAQRANIEDPESVFLDARGLLGETNAAAPPNAAGAAPGGLPDVRSLRPPR